MKNIIIIAMVITICILLGIPASFSNLTEIPAISYEPKQCEECKECEECVCLECLESTEDNPKSDYVMGYDEFCVAFGHCPKNYENELLKTQALLENCQALKLPDEFHKLQNIMLAIFGQWKYKSLGNS